MRASVNVGPLPVLMAVGLLCIPQLPVHAQDAEAVERYRAAVDWSIGDIDGPEALTAVGQIVVADGRALVSQPRENLIRVVSANSGELLDEWGGSGEGPGEFQGLFWLGRVGDEIVALDSRMNRTTHFTFDGSVVGTRSYRNPPPHAPYLYGGWVFPTIAGEIIVFRDIRSSAAEEGVEADARFTLATSEGEVLDSLPAHRPGEERVRIDVGDRSIDFNRPFHAGDRFAMSPDGSRFVITRSVGRENMVLFVYDTNDRRLREVAPGLPDVELDAEYAEEAARERLELWLGSLPPHVGPADEGDVARAVTPPDSVPPVDEIFVTPEGEIWLREPNQGGTTDRWRVVGVDGAVAAEVEVPTGIILRARDGEHLWGYSVDPELSVQTVHRLRMEEVER